MLRERRKRTNLTQDGLAKKCGISRATINRLENGRYRPSVDVAKRIAAVLDFDWTLFFEKK